MNPRLLLIAAIAFAAYVLGAKAGHARYRQITKVFTRYWNDPTVKKARKKARRKGRKARLQAQKAANRRIRHLTH